MGAKQRLRAERRRAATAEKQNLSVRFSVDDDPEESGIEVDLQDQGNELDDSAALAAGGDQDTDLSSGGAAVDVDRPHEDEDDDEDGKAFEILKRQHDEIKAQKEAAEKRARDLEAAEARERTERERAEAAWREEQKRREELEEYRTKAERDQLLSHKTVIEHAIANANREAETAEQSYMEAMANMDYATAAKAQKAIAEAVLSLNRLNEGYQLLEERINAPHEQETPRTELRQQAQPVHQPERQAQPQDQFEAAISGLNDNDKTWLRQHKDELVSKPWREQLLRALAVQAETPAHLGGEGLTPGTAEYHAYLDEGMGWARSSDGSDDGDDDAAEPETRQPAQQQAPRRTVQKRPSAAPGSRATSSGTREKVFLTDWDLDQAKQLGMSEKQYAEFKRDAAKNQLTAGQTGGRLMARYSA